MIYSDIMAAIASKTGALSNLSKGALGNSKLLAVAAINNKVVKCFKSFCSSPQL